MFYRLRQFFYRFMSGRYGTDSFNNFLFYLYLIIAILNIFINSYILYLISTATVLFMFFRMLSRNTSARYRENQKFLTIKNKITGKSSLLKSRVRDRKVYVYKKCPFCKATLRLPRKKGKHTCKCPKCQESFNMRVF